MVGRWWVVAGLAASAGCAGVVAPPAHRGQIGQAVQRGAAVVSVQLRSSVADPYYVLSGPSETYRAYRLTERFSRHLEAYAARKSAPEGPTIDVTVTLESVSTDYRQIGGVEREAGRGLAGAPLHQSVRVAAAGTVAVLRLPSLLTGREWDGGGLSIPYEITKRARLAALVEVSSSGRSLARETVNAEAEEIVSWEDHDAWAYDYSAVFEALFRKVVAEVDRIVDQAAAGLAP
ncbi:MAG: hypothetical protein ACNA8S_07270 [Deferrisomatales bacterium]